MWYFMAGMESMSSYISYKDCEFGLMTFFGLNQKIYEKSKTHINHILIDSGAYSYRVRGKKDDFDSYINRYIEFIKTNKDDPKIIGFFELDIDSIIGYEKVLEYRAKLESITNKIIPVWHQNRGIKEFYKMCEQYTGKRVAVACVGWHDMTRSQLNWFINTAHKFRCKIHVLGMTHKELLKDLNLGLEDSFDSIAWVLVGAFGNIHVPLKDEIYAFKCLNKIPNLPATKFGKINYLTYRTMQEYYKDKDQSVEVN